MTNPDHNAAQGLLPQAPSPRRTFLRAGWHVLALLIALAGLAAYQHFKVEGPPSAALLSLVTASAFGFIPLRDLFRFVFRIEGAVVHVVHAVGALGLAILPLTGAVSGVPVLTHAAMAPFAIMGAAQAVMHQNHPRNAKQAEALRRFAASLPEVAAFASSKELRSPADAQRAVAALSDILAKAQALGETELESDPGFQEALRRTSTRFGMSLALDAVETSLNNIPASPTTTGAVQALRAQLTSARQTLAGAR
jgi:hypothetical protein